MAQNTINNILNKWKRRDFDYGDADCCQFAGFVAKELSGEDYLRDFHYNSESQAQQIIDSNGDLKSTVETVLGAPVKDPSTLPDGSPVLLIAPKVGEVMGIKYGNSAVCLVKKGMKIIPGDYITVGWKICQQ